MRACDGNGSPPVSIWIGRFQHQTLAIPSHRRFVAIQLANIQRRRAGPEATRDSTLHADRLY